MEKESRPYQINAITAVDSALKRGSKDLLLVLPCGTGKTYTFVQIVKDRGRVNFIVSTEELAEQGGIALLSELNLMPYSTLIQTIKDSGGLVNLIRKPVGEYAEIIAEYIGMIKADVFVIDKPIVISSAQTLHKRLNRIPFDHFKVIGCDEADLFLSKTFQEPLRYFSYDLKLGLTATPFRQDNLPLDDIFYETVYEYQLKAAINDGYLTKPIVVKLKTSTNLDDVHTLAGEFNSKELTAKVNTPERNFSIANAYIKYGEGRQFIAFCTDVQHTIDLCEAFNEKGIDCGYVVGDKELTPDRRGVLEQFASGELTGLTNCMILSVGYNYDDIGVEIMACPTKSKRKYIQQLGRGFRLKSAKFLEKWKQNIIIIDVVDGTTKHKLINTDELDRELALEDKIFISDENRQKLMDAKAKREALMNVVDRKEDEVFEMFPIPKVPRFKRCNDPASQMQLERIKALGHDIINNTYTQAHINDIFQSQPASKQDIDRLTLGGYDVSSGVTVIEARLAIMQMEQKYQKDKIKNTSNKIKI